MKKMLFLFLFTVSIIADEAPVQPVQGGSVKPVINEDIQMQSEIITINLYRTYYEVEVNYVFVNTGSAQQVIMGFPNYDGDMYVYSIQNFKAYENGKNLFVFRQDAAEQPVQDKYYSAKLYYECSEVYFEAGETKRIKNTYTQVYLRNYDDTYRRAEYILTTGAYWKGNIEKIEVIVNTPGIPDAHLLDRIAHISDYEYNEILNLSGITFEPASFRKKKGSYHAVFTDTDPDFDIQITMPPIFSHYIEASSTLEPQAGNSYEPEKVFDNDYATAWVEGKTGSGIGEELIIHCAPSIAGGKIQGNWLLDGIGIVNGYAKSSSAFQNNNRIKTVTLTIGSFNDRGEKVFTEKTYHLDDTMKLQRIDFPHMTEAAEIQLKIAEVWKGKKYDDTCISEIIFYPSQD